MKTTNGSTKICAGYEPIAGYKLEQLIGRGGFGEVWRSEAPGGLHKAVKFVYGTTDQHQAVRELRSLERIKGVHHPFLLTLERFGVVDDRLVIVTELADGSLEEVYNRHRERGSCGIPRASLLSYLHDAADALDYLHSKYQLQHLDIKPGNLLLVGGHVKVGDFGLLKDLRDADCSMVGGLTPVYAPPELFDGRPSLHSDQYSLAVMYQELLTGTRPFGGRTIAQLATQHVHSAPNLSPLPASDRPVIARALEKDPKRRFESCCEFVDALRATASSAVRFSKSEGGHDQTETMTGVLRPGNAVPAPAVKDLPQLNVSTKQGGVRITGHSLIVAIGGTGAKVLHFLRDRVASHRAACPLDLHSILIDTDMYTIQAARLAEVSDRVPVCQTIHTPLRSPQEYRSYQGHKYKSLSRRWLYNIPRSGATEGMRPLGRLALVDHGDEIIQKLEESIRHLSAVSGRTTPRVYVVASLDGGTGSGMVLDVIHLIRHLLDKESMAEVHVMPLLTTGPMQRDQKRPLASADAAATYAEMNYFLAPGNGYPGDSAANWPSVPSARTPLVDAYVVAAGLDGEATPDPIDTLSEYIWADSTGVGDFLAAARSIVSDESNAAQISRPSVRSVGMIKLRTPKILEENLLAPSIVRQLLYRWLGDPSEAKQLAPELAAKIARRCGITKANYAQQAAGEWPTSCEQRIPVLVEAIQSLPDSVRNNPASFQQALQAIASQLLGCHDATVVESSLIALKREISVRLSDGRGDLALAIELLNCLENLVSQAAEDCRAGRIADDCNSEGPSEQDSDSIVGLANRWLWRVICFNTAEIFDHLKQSIDLLRGRIIDQASVLAQCISLVSQRLAGNDEEVWRFVDEGIRSRVGTVIDVLRNQVSSSIISAPLLVDDFEPRTADILVQSLIDHSLPLISAAMTWGEEDASSMKEPALQSAIEVTDKSNREKLPGLGSSNPTEPTPSTPATHASHTSIVAATVSNNSTSVLMTHESSANPQDEEVQRAWDDEAVISAALRAVRPALLHCGGYQRLLLIVGSELEREKLEAKVRNIHNGPLTTTVVPGAAAMLVCEAQQIYLSDIHARIVTVAGNDQDLMGRLAARNDIDWKSTSHPEMTPR